MSPNSGKMLDTDFSITLSGWSTQAENTPMFYVLYGVTQQEPLKRFKLTSTKTLLEGLTLTLTMKLPYVIALQVEIFDVHGEYAST